MSLPRPFPAKGRGFLRKPQPPPRARAPFSPPFSIFSLTLARRRQGQECQRDGSLATTRSFYALRVQPRAGSEYGHKSVGCEHGLRGMGRGPTPDTRHPARRRAIHARQTQATRPGCEAFGQQTLPGPAGSQFRPGPPRRPPRAGRNAAPPSAPLRPARTLMTS